jgi:hypothetical protein
MKRLITIFVAIATIMTLGSCTENYSNGTRIGTVNKFSRSGLISKSWEGHLNITQTGMTSTTGFDFSVDNDNEPVGLVKTIDSAMNYGWKVELIYHQTHGKNWFGNRGNTDYFITSCNVIDRNFTSNFSGKAIPVSTDTVVACGMKYIVIHGTLVNLTKDSVECFGKH